MRGIQILQLFLYIGFRNRQLTLARIRCLRDPSVDLSLIASPIGHEQLPSACPHVRKICIGLLGNILLYNQGEPVISHQCDYLLDQFDRRFTPLGYGLFLLRLIQSHRS